MNNQKPKIFLSYAREDMGMAKQLYNDLKRYGLDVWLDTESLLPGDRWKDKIQEVIDHRNYVYNSDTKNGVATSISQAVAFGDGTQGLGIEIMPAGNIELMSGILDYNN